MRRTDLICENAMISGSNKCVDLCVSELYGTKYTDITLDEDTAGKLGRSAGRYITVFTGKGDTEKCLCSLLTDMIPPGDALVAGLGNENICSDSFGTKSLGYIPATAHLAAHSDFAELGLRKVYVMESGVTGKTGIESSSRISSEARYVGASVIVAIDSLACSEQEKLCNVIQITDTGISPGSGVGNDRKALDTKTAGIPVIAIGVPTVINLDCITGTETGTGLMVTPRSIDVSVHRLAGTTGRALSRALNPGLSEEEISSLIIL